MVIYRCDRCNKLMNKPCNKIRVEKGYNFSLEIDEVDCFDICENCSKEFTKFIQGVKTKEVINE